MTIEAKLKGGPVGYGLPLCFSMTGDQHASNSIDDGGAVFVRGNKFVGYAEGQGGRVETMDEQLGDQTEIQPNTTQNVRIYFRDKSGKRLELAIYEVKGT